MTIMSSYIKGKLFINHPSGSGFSETYKFGTTNYDDAKAKFRTILNYRALMMAGNLEIVWATLSNVDSARDSVLPGIPSATVSPPDNKYLHLPAATDVEAGVPEDPETCNRMSDGMLMLFTTVEGKWSNFLYRGLRDSWVDDTALTFTVNGTPTALGSLPAPAGGLTIAQITNSFLSAVFYNTSYAKKISPGVYDVRPWYTMEFQRVGERDCGAGFSFSRGRKKHTV